MPKLSSNLAAARRRMVKAHAMQASMLVLVVMKPMVGRV